MLDLVAFVLAEAGQALRIERGLDLARSLVAVGFGDGAVEIAVAHQGHTDIGGLKAVGHGNVEMGDARADVGDDFCQLRLAVGACAPGEHTDWPNKPPDAIDPARQMIFGAEGGLEKTLNDLGVGKISFLRALTFCDIGNLRPGQCPRRKADECDRRKQACRDRRQARAQFFTTTVAPTKTRL
jgi:hypothetical protein